MNITQYRELVAQEALQAANPAVEVKPEVIAPVVTEEPIKTPPVAPEKITVDGEEFTIEELKNGYLRQKDYTQKTQEVARQREESKEAIAFYEHLKQNPQLAEQIKQVAPVPTQLDPAMARVADLEAKLYDMKLERDIEVLQNKYPDFEIREVIKMAQEKQIVNLEDAYHLIKSSKPVTPVDTEALKRSIRQEILAELKQEGISTQTLISSNDGTAHIPDNKPSISPDEQKVARMMGLTEAVYVKWRDASTRK